MGHDIVTMSNREIDRYHVIRQLLEKRIKTTTAATQLQLSTRQVKRLKKRLRTQGKRGLIHQSRGRTSNHQLPEKKRMTIVALLRQRYPDFGPTLATEKLAERHRLVVSDETVRHLMIESGLWKPKTGSKNSVHRQWRARKDAFGEMEQFDGSYHHWLEDRGGTGELCLLASIDDATGKITKAVFAAHEGVVPVFAFWKGYLLTHGKPRAIYLDKFSTYKMNAQVAKENHETLTQFQRAMSELNIDPLTAHSPEAKGRVERLFQTLQDRLVKELRLRGINDVETANCFLEKVFIPDFNKKFVVSPASSANAHRPLTAKEQKDLDAVFSRQETRVVRNDFTFSYHTAWYQLTPDQPVTVCKKDVITIEERLDGILKFRLRGKYLATIVLPTRPKRVTVQTPWVIVKTKTTTPWRPAHDHPWRHRSSTATTTLAKPKLLIPSQG